MAQRDRDQLVVLSNLKAKRIRQRCWAWQRDRCTGRWSGERRQFGYFRNKVYRGPTLAAEYLASATG
jgi:hypothetical protein